MSSNSIFISKACLAASANSSPAASIGPEFISWILGREKPELTRQNDELATVFVIKSVLALARKNICDEKGDVLYRSAHIAPITLICAVVSNLLQERQEQTYDSA
jgi:hypothetical protein